MSKDRATSLPWSPSRQRQFVRRLLGWYRREGRDFPWRSTRDPYAIWVSEVMLQQTRTVVVVPYHNRWLRRFPDVRALARAHEATVLRYWSGLGYYRRARALHAAARHLVARADGSLPSDVTALRKLPGVGSYTAGAIASLAFGVRTPVVDGNVTRVLCRLFALPGDPRSDSALNRQLWSWAAQLVPRTDPGDFNQALMELGATRCRPRSPDCQSCPVADFCEANRRGTPDAFPPVRTVRTRSTREVAGLITDGARWLLVQRGEQESCAGMWECPVLTGKFGSVADYVSQLMGGDVLQTTALSPVHHQVMDRRIAVTPVLVRLRTAPPSLEPGMRWATLRQARRLPHSARQRRLLERIREVEQRDCVLRTQNKPAHSGRDRT